MRRPVAFVGATGTNGTTGTSIALSTPPSVALNDLLLAFIIRNDQQNDASTPFEKATASAGAGWVIPDGRTMYFNYADGGNPLPGWIMRNCWCWKIATASEPATHTFNMRNTADQLIGGVMLAYRYHQLTWDLNSEPTPFRNTPTCGGEGVALSNVGPSFSGATDSRFLTVSSRGSPSFSSGTQRVTANANGTSFITVADEALTVNGATGTRTCTGGSTGPSLEMTRTMEIQAFTDAPATMMV